MPALSSISKSSAPLFAALGDETRLGLVTRLCNHGPMSITGLAEGSRITRQAITKHLRVMEQARLVRSAEEEDSEAPIQGDHGHTMVYSASSRISGQLAEPDPRRPGARLRVDGRTHALAGEALAGTLADATDEDWDTEFLAMILAVGIVDSVEEAIAHVNAHGSGHSEAIVTDSAAAARAFERGVDAACVYVNASTRFTDGGQFGMGAEIGNSTQKLHARGPIGLRELCTFKYLVEGDGHVRA